MGSLKERKRQRREQEEQEQEQEQERDDDNEIGNKSVSTRPVHSVAAMWRERATGGGSPPRPQDEGGLFCARRTVLTLWWRPFGTVSRCQQFASLGNGTAAEISRLSTRHVYRVAIGLATNVFPLRKQNVNRVCSYLD